MTPNYVSHNVDLRTHPRVSGGRKWGRGPGLSGVIPDESPGMDGMTPESIRGARNALKLTQAEAAKRLGVAWLSISRWENGRTRPTSPAHIRALTAMLNEAKAGMVAEATPF